MTLKKFDQRHQRRAEIMQALFALDFEPNQTLPSAEEENYPAFVQAQEILDQKDALDQQVVQVAKERPLEQINKVDLAILRLIVFESNSTKTPKKVLIDEAVELAKEFGADSSPKFVNGVLGKLLISDSDTKDQDE